MLIVIRPSFEVVSEGLILKKINHLQTNIAVIFNLVIVYY